MATLRIDNDPLGMVSLARLSYRQRGAATWREVLVPTGPLTRVRLEPPEGDEIELYWTLLDGGGHELLAVGSVGEPVQLRIETAGWADAPRLAETDEDGWGGWWLWTVVGAVVVAGGVTAAVLLTREGTPGCPGDIECIRY